ncbi:MAG: DUF4973 domain-containing protein [Odoribacter splanchnicus]
MKKYRLLFLYILGMTVAACNNDLPDELFVKRVVIAENGFQDLRLEYPEDGTVNTQITISISGTSVLSKDVEAQVKVCPDTLDDYNYERFVQDTMLYYTLLPEDCYTLENEGKVTIKKGDEYALLSVQFDLSRLDMFKDYVLPLEVSSVSDYEVGEPKYRKALFHLNILNNFSYVYTPSGAKVYNSGDNDDYTAWTTDLTLSTLNYNTCRMYAGGVYETDTDRDRYVIRVTVNSDSTLSYTAMTPEINLITEGDASQNRISISESPDLLVQNKSVITTTLKMNYSYTYTSPEGYPYHRRFEGTFTNDRTVFRDKDGNIREEW